MAQELGVDGVDLNLGCPQRRASENHYGAYMTDRCDWQLCYEMIKRVCQDHRVTIPITAKIRLLCSLDDTIEFALLLRDAGASMITVHGRTRGKDDARRDGSADLTQVRAVIEALKSQNCPVVTNGNVRYVLL